MKVTVKIDDRFFEVEIENLHTRPIVATVEGERFEVWPEGGFVARPLATSEDLARQSGVPDTAPTAPEKQPPDVAGAPVKSQADVKAVHAPIPGVIVALEVAVGDVVEVGQPLCVLEAMKMKNAIRAPRPGTIAAIHVTTGEHVKHHDLLMEYAD